MRLLDQDKPRSVDAIAERLELARRALGKNQRKFAMEADVSPPTYNNWKQGIGRPDIDMAYKLCDAHGLTIEWIYEGDATRLPAALVERMREIIAKEKARSAA